MPKEIESEILKGNKYGYSSNEFWFSVDNVATYKICNGNTIEIKVLGSNKSEIKTFLLGSAFGALLIQRNIVAIHGGTVLINDVAVTITGDTGAGKSTLTSAFCLNGSKFFADDVSALNIYEDGDVYIRPAYPQQKLCRDAIIKLGVSFDNLRYIDEERDKFAIPSKNLFINHYDKLKYIVEVEIDKYNKSKDEVEIKEIKGIEKFKSLMKNIYRVELIDIIGMKNEYFKNVSRIASKVKYYKVTRKEGSFTVDKQINLIKSVVIN